MFEIIILLLAGIGAGIVTGLIGASAVIIVAPLLIIFLDYPAYIAIGIALGIDVFASLFATYMYHKNGKIKIRPSLILLISALIAVVLGSYYSVAITSNNLSIATGVGIALMGLIILIKREKNLPTNKLSPFLEKYTLFLLVLIGLLIGSIAGVFGAGGGMMILLALILILKYNTHEAIGTSVFLMIFIALFGGVAHYINMPFSITSLFIGAVGGILGAVLASKFANSLDEKVLRKIVGCIIMTLGLVLVLNSLFF